MVPTQYEKKIAVPYKSSVAFAKMYMKVPTVRRLINHDLIAALSYLLVLVLGTLNLN